MGQIMRRHRDHKAIQVKQRRSRGTSSREDVPLLESYRALLLSVLSRVTRMIVGDSRHLHMQCQKFA